MTKEKESLITRLASRYHRVIKFGVVGASGIPVNLIFVWVGKVFLFKGLSQGFSDGLSYLLGIVVSILTNYLLNYWWTWGDRRGKGVDGFFRQMGKFYVVSAVAAVIQYLVTIGASALMKGYPSLNVVLTGEYRVYNLLAPPIGIVVAFAVNYVANNRWTFRA